MKLDYTVELESGQRVSGSRELTPGENRIAAALPEGVIRSVLGTLALGLAAGEKIFMNGYQTWTWCPEYDRDGFTPPLKPMPGPVTKYFGIDRYGDYHFVDYPHTPGVTHGESYCYFRLGARFRLLGSLDERPGYTLFRYDARAEVLTIARDCSGICCGGEYSLFELFLAQGGEDEVFDGWFRAMGVKPRTMERLAGYSSWYNRYQKIDEGSILSDLEGCGRVFAPGDLFQIDDGWESAVGDWLEPDGRKFPGGMGAMADRIHGRGLKAGLWLAPFVCQRSSRLYKEHPDWLLRVEGRPWYCGCNWGGFYSLDIDRPEVCDYVERSLRRALFDWDYDLVKLDFLYGAAPFGNDRETRAGRMTRAMELLRRACGDKLILGCGVPLAPAFGLVDYCRISCDVGLDWDGDPIRRGANREFVSTRRAVSNSVFRRQLNGRAWLSDPDVFFLREDNLRLSDREKHILATVNSLFGGMLLCSDDVSRYTPEAMEQYRQLLRNRDAGDIRVEADGGLSISYTVDGAAQILELNGIDKGMGRG